MWIYNEATYNGYMIAHIWEVYIIHITIAGPHCFFSGNTIDTDRFNNEVALFFFHIPLR